MDVIESTARWTLIEGALTDVHQAVDRALIADELDVAALFRQVEAQFDALYARLLASGLAKKVCDDSLVALAFYVDEVVLERLAQSQFRLQADWPLLRRFEQDERYGGDAFFARAERLCSEGASDERTFVIDVYLYCLNRGFVGCFVGRADEIERRRGALWRARGAPSVSVVTQPRAPLSVGNVAPFWILALLACILVVTSVAMADRSSVEGAVAADAGRTDAAVDVIATQ